jgi:hypothetical protein
MSASALVMIACAIIGLNVAPAHAETCSDEIAQLEELVVQSMAARPTLRQSTDAQLHHQPTPQSVGRAEENALLRFTAILARAKALNADGKTAECIQSVAEAMRLLRHD